MKVSAYSKLMDPIQERLSSSEQRALTEFRSRLRQAFGNRIVEMRLFGSRARGDSHEESDVDVLVLITQTERDIKHAIWDMANDLLLETDIYLSPLVMSVDEFHLLRDRERRLALDIEREGILL